MDVKYINGNSELTVADLKKLIAYMPDSAVVRVCNGHSVWDVTEYDYECNPASGEYTGIELTSPNMPKFK